jgi:hypothetical protein
MVLAGMLRLKRSEKIRREGTEVMDSRTREWLTEQNSDYIKTDFRVLLSNKFQQFVY